MRVVTYGVMAGIIILSFVFARPLLAGLFQDRSRFFRHLSWVYIEMINLENEKTEKLEDFRNLLKKDVTSMFRNAGVMVTPTEKKEDIGTHDYLKIRIHKIVLERTVYLSAIEIINQEKTDLKGKANNEVSLRYTDVFDRFESVRPIITNRIEKMIGWYIMK